MIITFDQLVHATRICHATHSYFLRVYDWSAKREHLKLYLHDLPRLLQDYTERHTQAHPTNPSATLVDVLPELRLATACEGMTHAVYSMAEIAASVGCAASHGAIPASFNRTCKMVAAGKLKPSFTAALHDLEWYARVRELRTEWCHHSSMFIGGEANDPLICVRAYRRKSDQLIMKGELRVRPRELADWSGRATGAIDAFGSAIFEHFILPTMPLSETVYCPEIDDLGFPKMVDGRMQGRRVTIREYLAMAGIVVNC